MGFLGDEAAALGEALEKLEVAGAKESWKILSGSVGKLAGGGLVSGLQGVLQGAAAAAFEELRKRLGGVWNVLKRAVVRIAKWVVEKLKSLLPKSFDDKVDELMKSVQDVIEKGAEKIGADIYGAILGRAATEEAWSAAAAAGKDLKAAEDKLGEVVASHTARIAWVTKARGALEKFDGIFAAAVGVAPAAAQLAFAAIVAAILGFIALQVWDGFNDIEALV